MNATDVVPVSPPGSSGAAAPDDPRVVRALEEYIAALQAGQRPDRQEFQARYPEVATVLGECLEVLEFVQAAAPDLQGPTIDQAVAAAAATKLFPEGPLGDYRIVREVGRGGMGVVYEVVQLSLGRRAALKVLPFAAALDARQLQRFKNEAQAAAQLHHQNIVPVYGVGCERGIYYYSMQFIDGQTLAEMIADLRRQQTDRRKQPDPGQEIPREPATPAPPSDSDQRPSDVTEIPSDIDRRPAANTATPPVTAVATEQSTSNPAFFRTVAKLGVQAAQALEHAHGLGVVHRDIKPANLLVDLRGHLWITDFGLAHCQRQAGLTMTGDLVGTLRYMSPEQALARRGLVDHRTDVYSLGVTLYELLTLRPAFAGLDQQELLRQIACEEAKPPRRENKAIPPELETIVLKAMEKNPNDRYTTAQELADDLERFLKDEAIHARRPTLAKRLQRWSRRHRPVVWTATVCLLLTAVALAGSIGWIVRDREVRLAASEQLVHDTLRQARELLAQGQWPEARALARRAEGVLAGSGGSQEAQDALRQLLADLDMVVRVEDVRLRQSDVKDEQYFRFGADERFQKAFQEYGLDVETWDPHRAAEWIKARPIRSELVAALDEWAALCRLTRPPDDQTWKHLLMIARAADPDPGRDQLRAALEGKQPDVLVKLAESEQVKHWPPATLVLLAKGLVTSGSLDKAIALLQKARQQYPGDFWINQRLAWCLENATPPQLSEAVRYYTAAVSLRPQSAGNHVNLGVALAKRGSVVEALAAFHEAIRLQPDYAAAYYNLGQCALQAKKLEEAVRAFRKAIDLRPGEARFHNNLGSALVQTGADDEAIAAFREAIRLHPGLVPAHWNLGLQLERKGRLAEAIVAYRKVIDLEPNLAAAHNDLGRVLQRQGQIQDAIAAYDKALRLRPDHAETHFNLGNALRSQGRQQAAIAAYQQAIRLQPGHVGAHCNLGNAFSAQGNLDAAIAAYEAAIRLQPKLALAHANLARAQADKENLEAAIAAYRQAIKCKPDFALAYCDLGKVYMRQERFTEALAALRRCHELGSRDPQWSQPSAYWAQECERLVALDNKLPAFLKGSVAPASAADAIRLARLCAYKGLHGASARFFQNAFAAWPALAAGRGPAYRYEAARSAALAGCGQGKDVPPLDAEAQARWRGQALSWLRADLAAWTRQLLSNTPQAHALVQRTLRKWQHDPAFIGVRDAGTFASLPAAEQDAWRRLWAEVDVLRKQAQRHDPN